MMKTSNSCRSIYNGVIMREQLLKEHQTFNMNMKLFVDCSLNYKCLCGAALNIYEQSSLLGRIQN